MRYKIAICDDMEQDAQYIASHVQKWADQAGAGVELQSFPSAESFLFHYEGQKDFDILLLDIEMGVMNGVELARKVRLENEQVQIVFITGFPDFIAEGYEVEALHYLMKPISYEKLVQVLDRAVSRLSKEEKSVLFTVDREITRVAVKDIIAVEAFAHSSRVTTRRESFEVKTSITAVERLLEDTVRKVDKENLAKAHQNTAGSPFIRCHRSYLVSIPYIKSISKTEVLLDNGMRLPLSKGNYQAVNQAFIQYYRGEVQWDS